MSLLNVPHSGDTGRKEILNQPGSPVIPGRFPGFILLPPLSDLTHATNFASWQEADEMCPRMPGCLQVGLYPLPIWNVSTQAVEKSKASQVCSGKVEVKSRQCSLSPIRSLRGRNCSVTAQRPSMETTVGAEDGVTVLELEDVLLRRSVSESFQQHSESLLSVTRQLK